MRAMNEPKVSSSSAGVNERGPRHWAVIALVVLAVIVACGPRDRHRRGPHQVPWAGMNAPPPTAAELVTRLQQRLELTASQQEAVRPIMVEHCRKRDLIMERYTAGGPNAYGYFKGATRALQQETETQLGAVLTEKQMAEYREMEAARQKKMQKAGGGWRGGPGGGSPEEGVE